MFSQFYIQNQHLEGHGDNLKIVREHVLSFQAIQGVPFWFCMRFYFTYQLKHSQCKPCVRNFLFKTCPQRVSPGPTPESPFPGIFSFWSSHQVNYISSCLFFYRRKVECTSCSHANGIIFSCLITSLDAYCSFLLGQCCT